MKKKILIIFAVLVVIIFGFYILKGDRFQKTNIFENKEKDLGNNSDENNIADGSNGEENIQSYVAPDIEIKSADCDNNCQKFNKDNEKEYCQIICGMDTFFEDGAEEGGSPEDCDEEKGVQKDYCLKDIAVGNKDAKTCEQISDANIKKSCQNRMMEDLLEEQKLEDMP